MIRRVCLVGLVGLVFVGAAVAGSPLARLTVDKAFRQAELARSHAFGSARVTCSWSAGTFTYGCVTWTPSATSTGIVVNGVSAHVYSRRAVQACTKAGTAGCVATTAKPSCLYALGTYSASGSTATYRIVNVCRTGWVKQLA